MQCRSICQHEQKQLLCDQSEKGPDSVLLFIVYLE